MSKINNAHRLPKPGSKNLISETILSITALKSGLFETLPNSKRKVRGDMSIPGPWPHMLKHTDEYSKIIGQHMVRQFVKPGITGWAQVNGFRGETQNVFQMQKRVEHDLWYLENWNLLLDIKIFFMTIFNVVRGRGECDLKVEDHILCPSPTHSLLSPHLLIIKN
jgi:Bacterial sugar transferase